MSQAAAQDVGSGRAFSRARREALSRGGKSTLVARKAQASPAPAPVASTPRVASVAKPQAAQVSETIIAEARRTEPSTAGTAQSVSDCGCEHAAEAAPSDVAESLCELVERDPTALGDAAASVRALCRDRRNALSGRGKAALPPVVRAAGSARGMSRAAAVTGRDAARRYRAERCEAGRGDMPACRPTGRVRPTPGEVAPKVEVGTTLAGLTVTGTQVERTTRVTGNEPGSCRVITGTEYIGAEQYGNLCDTRPEPGPMKVVESATRRGQRVTGTELGKMHAVTGDEAGTCKTVTGIDYITNERFQSVCRTRPEPPPARLGDTATQGGVKLTGTLVGRASKVTGDEPGSCKRLTGTQYTGAQNPEACQGSPEKVHVVHTEQGMAVTGTPVGHAAKVTGDEAGACQPVSGTDYVGPEQCGAPGASVMAKGARKVGLSRTWMGQPVSGTQVGRTGKVTGDEHGACKPITGSSYIARNDFEQHCDADAVAETQARVPARRASPGLPLTGSQPGPDAKVTGITGRGACQPISGTPYIGSDQFAAACSHAAVPAARAHHRVRAPADEPLPVAHAETDDVPRAAAFSVLSPARSAQIRDAARVTGTAYGTAGRITGPVALAPGLVSGTAEFRYRNDGAPAAPARETPASSRERITGEGRDAGIRVTGDDWARSGRVTGTEGIWAKGRNPTLRGDGSGQVARAAAERVPGAQAFKGRERPEVPVSRITGSSGNAGTGAVVTLSGGARG